MKKKIKFFLQIFIKFTVKIFSKNRYGLLILDMFPKNLMNQSQEVYHNGTKLLFTKANEICAWRIKSFSSKEPETLDWIDSMENNSIIWDIGANIGLYSCYAAKKVKNSKVFAFEPSVFNLEILARNIHLNDLSNQINMVPLAVTEKLGFENLNSSFDDWGSALSTFGHNYTHDGKNIEINFKTSQLGISIEDAVKVLKIPQPDYIKIDVDGIEHLILKIQLKNSFLWLSILICRFRE